MRGNPKLLNTIIHNSFPIDFPLKIMGDHNSFGTEPPYAPSIHFPIQILHNNPSPERCENQCSTIQESFFPSPDHTSSIMHHQHTLSMLLLGLRELVDLVVIGSSMVDAWPGRF